MGIFALGVRRIEQALIALAALCALLMMLHVSADLFSRFVLGKQFQGTIEIVSAYYMVALVFFPLACVDRMGANISADVFTNLMSPRVRALSARFTDVVTLICIGALVYFSAREALIRTADGEVWRSGEFLIPVWCSRWFLPLGGAGMFLSVLLHLCGNARSAAARH
jgi:TRAP-type C4-dicarboxylate transport system permease small subunit